MNLLLEQKKVLIRRIVLSEAWQYLFQGDQNIYLKKQTNKAQSYNNDMFLDLRKTNS